MSPIFPRDSSSRANNARIRVPGERFRAGEEPRERRLNKTAWRFLTSVHLESGFRRDRDFWKERIRLGNGGPKFCFAKQGKQREYA